MPGVVVTTATQSGPSAPLRAASGQFFVVGLTERGSTTDPILLRGKADMSRLLGTRVSYGAVWDAVQTFFDEGGQQCYVSRIVGTTPTVGTLTLVDRAGSPLNTIRVDAANPGSWSTQVKIEVVNGSLANTYRINVYLNDVLVEYYNNLATPADAVSRFAASPFIRCTDLASATAAPNNNPALLIPTALSAGTDDRATVVAANYVTGLNKFVRDLGDGAVAIPGQSVNAIWTGINTHCIANNRIGLLAGARNDSVATLQTRSTEVNSEFCGIFAPYIRISDGVNGYYAISPEGYVAGARARAHDLEGPWRAPAGAISQARAVLEPDQKFTKTEADTLDAARVSAIRTISNTTRLYGWRSLSGDETNYMFLKDRDVLNYLVTQCEAALEPYVFDTIDAKGQLLSAINAALVGVVEPIRQAGGLFEKFDPVNNQMIDPGYKVVTGSEVNTVITLATNTVNAQVFVRISPTGGLIKLTIIKVGLNSGM